MQERTLPTPTVSMFLPTYARMSGGHLQRAVDSALRQTFEDFELLVVDDASMDGSAEFLEQVAAADERVKVIRLDKNSGLPAFALAQAYPLARGDIFAWLFDDCELAPDHLATLVGALEANPGAGMAYGKARAQLSEGSGFDIGAPLDKEAMERGANMVPNVCVAVRREVIASVGWYDPHVLLKRLCDWDLWLRIAREHEVVFVDRVLATEHGVGLMCSLGRMYHAAPALAVRYAMLDRRDRLAPETLHLADAREIPPGLDLDAQERIELEFMLFEHALLSGDTDATSRVGDRLAEAGVMEAATQRFVMQNKRDPEHQEMTLLVAAELLRRRLRHAASSQIEVEIEARAALDVASERSDLIHALEQRVDQLNRGIAEEREQLGRLQALADERLQEIDSIRGASAAAARLHELAQRELARTSETLFVYRDAADQRLSLLLAANARIDELNAQLQAKARGTESDPSPVGGESTERAGDFSEDERNAGAA